MPNEILYRVEVPTTQDIVTAKKEFRANYAMIKYQKDKYYPNLVAILGLSKNNGSISKIINLNKGKRGRPKKGFERDEKSPYYKSSKNHETIIHQHIYIGGEGSAMVAQKIRRRKNATAKKVVSQYFNYKNKEIPILYVQKQSVEFRGIGNYKEYTNRKFQSEKNKEKEPLEHCFNAF